MVYTISTVETVASFLITLDSSTKKNDIEILKSIQTNSSEGHFEEGVVKENLYLEICLLSSFLPYRG